MMAAMFIFMFVYGYNQYLWPIIMTTSEKYWTVIMGMKIIFMGNTVERFAYIILSMMPPVFIIIFLQRWFIQGLFQSK
jgi:sn-glycerol 3-phosphate transport system permease protein